MSAKKIYPGAGIQAKFQVQDAFGNPQIITNWQVQGSLLFSDGSPAGLVSAMVPTDQYTVVAHVAGATTQTLAGRVFRLRVVGLPAANPTEPVIQELTYNVSYS